MESYKHQFAKQTLARWLADPEQEFLGFNSEGGPYGKGVFTEYPFCLDLEGKLHGSKPWRETGLNDVIFENDVPTYQQCIDAKLLPICIFDIAVGHEGRITRAFEIVHKHDITEEKRGYIGRVMGNSSLFRVHVVDADWVLSQVRRPSFLKTRSQITWGD